MPHKTESNPFASDLLWAINSPTLLGPLDDGVSPLDPSQVDRDELATFLRERPDHRVGHYFENLVHFWLKHIRGVEIVAHRQPVRDGERTLGELDFIFRDEAGLLHHWEIAVKFYLLTKPDGGALPRYLGPNTTDSLERKIARLNEHQLPLSQHVHPDIHQRRAFVKGRIYYHPSATQKSAGLPDLNPAHLRGIWIHRNELKTFLANHPYQTTACVRLPKPFWLTAAGDRITLNELLALTEHHFASATNALHIALLDEHHNETQRLFIVPDEWPEQGS